MAKPELGTKRVCVACSTRFYDLTKAPAVCPKCGTEQPNEQSRPRRMGGNVVEEKRVKITPIEKGGSDTLAPQSGAINHVTSTVAGCMTMDVGYILTKGRQPFRALRSHLVADRAPEDPQPRGARGPQSDGPDRGGFLDRRAWR